MTIKPPLDIVSEGSQQFYRISFLSLGVRSSAMKSILSAGSNRIQELANPSSALTALNDPYRIIVVDGAATPSAAAIRIRKWGLVEALARRLQSGNPFLACGESAIALGVGRLDGKVRGLGVIPSRIGRVSRDTSSGIRFLGNPQGSQAWFNHDYVLIPSPSGWGPVSVSSSSLSYGDVRCVAFDPARSGLFGRQFISTWISSCVPMKEEAA